MSEANVTDNETKGPAKTPAQPKERGARKVRTGYVVSDKMQKTIVVEIEDRKQHALYGKIMRKSKRYKAHDEEGIANVGDRVRIVECRPLSKDKYHRLLEIVEKAK